MNFQCFNLKNDTATVNNHLSMDPCPIWHNFRHLVCVWHPTDNRSNFGRNGKKLISCSYQELVFARNNVLSNKVQACLILWGHCVINFNVKKNGLLNFVVVAQARVTVLAPNWGYTQSNWNNLIRCRVDQWLKCARSWQP